MPALGFAPRKPEGREIYSFVGLSTSLDWLIFWEPQFLMDPVTTSNIVRDAWHPLG